MAERQRVLLRHFKEVRRVLLSFRTLGSPSLESEQDHVSSQTKAVTTAMSRAQLEVCFMEYSGLLTVVAPSWVKRLEA